MMASSHSLTSLPYELLLSIVGERGLTFADIKSLRLVCRHFAHGAATSVLFHTVSLSRLRRHLDPFLAIAAHRQLAPQVRAIVWHELAEDTQPIDRDADYAAERPHEEHVYLEMELADAITKSLNDIFWLPPTTQLEHEPATDPAYARILQKLLKTLISLPNLYTLVSRPMHSTYRLTDTADTTNYPLTTQNLTGGYGELITGTAKHLDQMNFGFFWLLLPAAALRPPECPIRRLYYSDEHTSSSLIRLATSHTRTRDAFCHLTHVDLCISRVQHDNDLVNLGECLRSAKGLTFLQLCFENGESYTDHEGLGLAAMSSCSGTALGIILGCGEQNQPGRDGQPIQPRDPDFKWNHFRELRLSHCRVPASVLASFMRKHASTLNKLHLFDSRLTVRDIFVIGQSLIWCPLALERFAIVQDQGIDPVYWIDHQHLVDLINASSCMAPTTRGPETFETYYSRLKNNRDPHIMEVTAGLGEAKKAAYIYTHAPVFDDDAWQTGPTWDRRMHDGIAFNPSQWEELVEESGDTLRYPFAHSDQFWAHSNLFEDDESSSFDDHEYISHDYSMADWLGEWPEPNDGFKWVLAPDSKGVLYYWQEVDSPYNTAYEQTIGGDFTPYTSERYQTELWRFTHHSQEKAIGTEPLEFWEDWVGAEAGDVAEPIPLGTTFNSFLGAMNDVKVDERQDAYIRARGGVRYAGDVAAAQEVGDRWDYSFD